MKKNGKMMAVIIGIVVVAVIAGFFACNSRTEVRVRKQLALGQKYLEEMNYEQAVVAFELAIEIDPMSVDAYVGLADAYVGLGDFEKAFKVLERGYEQTQNEEIKRKWESLEAKEHEVEKPGNESGREEEMTELSMETETEKENEAETEAASESTPEKTWETPDIKTLNEYLSDFTEFMQSYDAEKDDANSLMVFVYEYIYSFGKGKSKSDGYYVYISDREVDRVLGELFNKQGPKDKIDAYYFGEKILYDGEFYIFNERDYGSMEMSLATVKNIDVIENGQYQVDFIFSTVRYMLDADEEFIENPIENWDVYYAYSVNEVEEDIFCSLVGTGTANMHYEDDGRLILDYLNIEEAGQETGGEPEQSKAQFNVYGRWENMSAESTVETLSITLNEDMTAVYASAREIFYGAYEIGNNNKIHAKFTYGEIYSNETAQWDNISNIEISVTGTLNEADDYMDVEIIDEMGLTAGVYNLGLTHIE